MERFLGVRQPTVSYRMKFLVGAGLVTAQKRGQKVYHECVTEGPWGRLTGNVAGSHARFCHFMRHHNMQYSLPGARRRKARSE